MLMLWTNSTSKQSGRPDEKQQVHATERAETLDPLVYAAVVDYSLCTT